MPLGDTASLDGAGRCAGHVGIAYQAAGNGIVGADCPGDLAQSPTAWHDMARRSGPGDADCFAIGLPASADGATGRRGHRLDFSESLAHRTPAALADDLAICHADPVAAVALD